MDDTKELRQPAGIETREVGAQGRYVLGFAEREKVARVAHEANRAYCATLGDFSQPAWDDAPDWQKESARAGVDAITMGEVTHPEDSHESWSRQKLAEGWRYGPEKNPATKEHPCLVPYVALPVTQRMKDHLFLAIVRTLTSDIG